MSYLIRNAQAEPVTVELRQGGLWRDGKVIDESLTSRRIDAYNLGWDGARAGQRRDHADLHGRHRLVSAGRRWLALLLALTAAAGPRRPRSSPARRRPASVTIYRDRATSSTGRARRRSTRPGPGDDHRDPHGRPPGRAQPDRLPRRGRHHGPADRRPGGPAGRARRAQRGLRPARAPARWSRSRSARRCASCGPTARPARSPSGARSSARARTACCWTSTADRGAGLRRRCPSGWCSTTRRRASATSPPSRSLAERAAGRALHGQAELPGDRLQLVGGLRGAHPRPTAEPSTSPAG